MIESIVRSDDPVTLLGGAPVDDSTLDLCLSLAPGLVAADSGAARALAHGRVPGAVIGDFDSLRPEEQAAIPPERLHRIAEQDSTDFDKALRNIAAPLVLAAGFTGARLDHELAVYNALVRHAARPCIVVGGSDICFHAPPGPLSLALEPDERVSLFPMAPVAGRAEGLRWPIDGLAFAPDARIGTSNRAVSGAVTLSMEAPGMLVILPRRALAAAARALAPPAGG
jgi:thiamine pyrophosphokinase